MIYSYAVKPTLILLAAFCICLSRCSHTPPPKKAFEPPVIKVGYVELKNRIDSAREESESVAAKINAELERLSRGKKQPEINEWRPCGCDLNTN